MCQDSTVAKQYGVEEACVLPNFPIGFDQTGLEDTLKELVNEMQKRTPHAFVVKEKMNLTFALRRKEVVEPAISKMVEL